MKRYEGQSEVKCGSCKEVIIRTMTTQWIQASDPEPASIKCGSCKEEMIRTMTTHSVKCGSCKERVYEGQSEYASEVAFNEHVDVCPASVSVMPKESFEDYKERADIHARLWREENLPPDRVCRECGWEGNERECNSFSDPSNPRNRSLLWCPECKKECTQAKTTMKQGDKYHCGNCDWKDTEEQMVPLGSVKDLHERLEPGDTHPHGGCPECGALAYLCD